MMVRSLVSVLWFGSAASAAPPGTWKEAIGDAQPRDTLLERCNRPQPVRVPIGEKIFGPDVLNNSSQVMVRRIPIDTRKIPWRCDASDEKTSPKFCPGGTDLVKVQLSGDDAVNFTCYSTCPGPIAFDKSAEIIGENIKKLAVARDTMDGLFDKAYAKFISGYVAMPNVMGRPGGGEPTAWRNPNSPEYACVKKNFRSHKYIEEQLRVAEFQHPDDHEPLKIELSADPLKCRSSSEVCFIVLGDQGDGNEKQAAIAKAMHDHIVAGEGPEKLDKRTDFIVGLGDNMYSSGAYSEDSDKFDELFRKPYAAIHRVFHMVMGNHDWTRGSPNAQLNYAKKSFANPNVNGPIWHMPSLGYTFKEGPVQFFAIDTSYIVKEFGTTTPVYKYQGDLIKELEQQLSKSTARWKIVFGHHPIFNHGEHGHSKLLAEKLLPLFVRYKVDAYLAGHQHNQQHLRHSNYPEIDFLVQGAGSKEGYDYTTNGPLTQWAWGGLGFSYIKISGESITIQMIGIDDRVLYSKTRTRNPNAKTPAPVSEIVKAECGPGSQGFAGNCFVLCRPGWEGGGHYCYKTCPPGYNNTELYCQRDPESIDTGSGTKNCPPGFQDMGATCYRGPATLERPKYRRVTDPLPRW